MSLIKKRSELTVSPYIKALIYGQPGVGKTTLAVSAPKPLLLDYDRGVHRVDYDFLEGVDTVQVDTYEDTNYILQKEDLSPYETLVFDTGGKLLDFMAMFIIKTNPKMMRGAGQLTLQGYGERKAMFLSLLRTINDLKKHVIFVAHRETRTEGDDTRYVPLFGGSNYDSLVTELDLVGYIEANGNKRTITFDPTSRNDGKNTCGFPSQIEIPTIKTGPENVFITNVINTYNERINLIMKESRDLANIMEEIKQNFSKSETIDEVCLEIDRIVALNLNAKNKRAAALLANKKAKELGYSYDKEKDQYVPINQPENSKHEG